MQTINSLRPVGVHHKRYLRELTYILYCLRLSHSCSRPGVTQMSDKLIRVPCAHLYHSRATTGWRSVKHVDSIQTIDHENHICFENNANPFNFAGWKGKGYNIVDYIQWLNIFEYFIFRSVDLNNSFQVITFPI